MIVIDDYIIILYIYTMKNTSLDDTLIGFVVYCCCRSKYCYTIPVNLLTPFLVLYLFSIVHIDIHI